MSDINITNNQIYNEIVKIYNLLSADVNGVLSNQKLILEGLNENSKQIGELRSEIEKLKTK